MSDERADRLRQSRNRAKQKARESEPEGTEGDSEQEPVSTSETSERSKPSKQDKPSERETEPESQSVKEDQVGTYMYLPESQHQDLSHQFNLLKAEYEYEYDEEFEKNRHFYPLVVQYGLESLEGLDASEIQELLDELHDD